jgi:membrane protease YdiL (CAAX protease family)
MRTLITPARTLSWRRFWLGFGLWTGLSVLSAVVEAVTHPGRYELTFDPIRLIPYAILALIFIPIQASTEELFFRAYLMQGLGRLTRQTWLLCLVSGLIFMAPHFLNPEAASNYALMGLSYFSMGAFLAYITLWDGRLELAMGVHTANNLFAVLIANTRVSSLPSPSVFTVNVLDPVFSVPAGLVAIGLFVLLMRGLMKREDKNDSVGA